VLSHQYCGRYIEKWVSDGSISEALSKSMPNYT
jgi:hypothetical protein